jgi:hypothetical protein
MKKTTIITLGILFLSLAIHSSSFAGKHKKNVAQLPTEIIYEIMTYLDPVSLTQASGVNREWNDLAHHLANGNYYYENDDNDHQKSPKEKANKIKRNLKLNQKAIFKKLRPHYNRVLRVVTKMMNPVQFKKSSRGGLERLAVAARTMQSLLDIHNRDNLTPKEKIESLGTLLETAKVDLSELNSMEKFDHRDLSWEEFLDAYALNEIDSKIKNLVWAVKKQTLEISTYGGNINTSMFLLGGAGLSVGQAKTPYGFREMVVAPQATFGMGVAGFGAYTGKYSMHHENDEHKFGHRRVHRMMAFRGHGDLFSDANKTNPTLENNERHAHFGTLLGTTDSEDKSHKFNELGGGLIFVSMSKEILSSPFRLYGHLKQDMKFFREQIGICPESEQAAWPQKFFKKYLL